MRRCGSSPSSAGATGGTGPSRADSDAGVRRRRSRSAAGRRSAGRPRQQPGRRPLRRAPPVRGSRPGPASAGTIRPTRAPTAAMSSSCTGMIQFSVDSPSRTAATSGRLSTPSTRRMTSAATRCVDTTATGLPVGGPAVGALGARVGPAGPSCTGSRAGSRDAAGKDTAVAPEANAVVLSAVVTAGRRGARGARARPGCSGATVGGRPRCADRPRRSPGRGSRRGESLHAHRRGRLPHPRLRAPRRRTHGRARRRRPRPAGVAAGAGRRPRSRGPGALSRGRGVPSGDDPMALPRPAHPLGRHPRPGRVTRGGGRPRCRRRARPDRPRGGPDGRDGRGHRGAVAAARLGSSPAGPRRRPWTTLSRMPWPPWPRSRRPQGSRWSPPPCPAPSRRSMCAR